MNGNSEPYDTAMTDPNNNNTAQSLGSASPSSTSSKCTADELSDLMEMRAERKKQTAAHKALEAAKAAQQSGTASTTLPGDPPATGSSSVVSEAEDRGETAKLLAHVLAQEREVLDLEAVAEGLKGLNDMIRAGQREVDEWHVKHTGASVQQLTRC
ncbi:hypothetical protein LTR48_002048 [Friedmanniomyces endolithicus]|uniref:Ribosome assembly protein 3 n=1 Tax=Rachicladosporium monterosium TaxID=1507873 RepID=A0ABR0LGD3_9PEZI|nr:hypothetical protein LTR29_016541 [Friedmanniomyces endolithicus]KAK1093565.1 hypothetical protein LTR48_002048 [Friedmanniomyces endolithicus]KAK5147926.1 hypothetical protein LTR32_000676 [Rachicladosporium monterosium]